MARILSRASASVSKSEPAGWPLGAVGATVAALRRSARRLHAASEASAEAIADGHRRSRRDVLAGVSGAARRVLRGADAERRALRGARVGQQQHRDRADARGVPPGERAGGRAGHARGRAEAAVEQGVPPRHGDGGAERRARVDGRRRAARRVVGRADVPPSSNSTRAPALNWSCETQTGVAEQEAAGGGGGARARARESGAAALAGGGECKKRDGGGARARARRGALELDEARRGRRRVVFASAEAAALVH